MTANLIADKIKEWEQLFMNNFNCYAKEAQGVHPAITKAMFVHLLTLLYLDEKREQKPDAKLRWVKASERLPDETVKVFWRRRIGIGDEYSSGYNVFKSDEVKYMRKEIEWLEEDAQSDVVQEGDATMLHNEPKSQDKNNFEESKPEEPLS